MEPHVQTPALTRPPITLVGIALALVAMVLTLVPAAPAFADELPHDFDIEAACQEDEAPSTDFQDIGPPHDQAIECLAWYDIARGRTSTHFGTNEPVTRAQAATFLVRLLEEVNGLQLPDRDEGAFSDVGGDSEFAQNIEILANVEPPILRGFEDGTFRPSEPILRDQFASVIDRAIAYVAREVDEVGSLPPGTSRFPDVGEESPHFEAIHRLADAAVVLGRADGNYHPRENVLRGQTASIMARVLGSLVYVGVVDRPADAPAGTVSGVVHNAENAQPDETGGTMSDVTVDIRGDAAREFQTDEDGEFWLNLPPGDYEVSVDADGYIPYLQHVSLANGQSHALDFRMYRSAQPPPAEDVVPTETTGGEVEVRDSFWVVPLIVETDRIDTSEAEQIILTRPDGVVLHLNSAGTSESWWSHDGDERSNRNEDEGQDGDHTLYYQFPDGHMPGGDNWYALEVTFGPQGGLTHVNDTLCTPCS